MISTGNFSYNHAEWNGGVMIIIETQTYEHYAMEVKCILFLIDGLPNIATAAYWSWLHIKLGMQCI